ncbi:hypothetical protein X798_00295 [Onchocerca flexuosa]|uniref:Uncharacterized protein n=1 Tax=Onchocerca flexuosa TaxID=387005 RepID=A0A238C5Q1_9BILA|nr:hypothetical protein X798_00295 [Onchocerca flexuosa]
MRQEQLIVDIGSLVPYFSLRLPSDMAASLELFYSYAAIDLFDRSDLFRSLFCSLPEYFFSFSFVLEKLWGITTGFNRKSLRYRATGNNFVVIGSRSTNNLEQSNREIVRSRRLRSNLNPLSPNVNQEIDYQKYSNFSPTCGTGDYRDIYYKSILNDLNPLSPNVNQEIDYQKYSNFSPTRGTGDHRDIYYKRENVAAGKNGKPGPYTKLARQKALD